VALSGLPPRAPDPRHNLVSGFSNRDPSGFPAIFLDRDGTLNDVVMRDGRSFPPPKLESFSLLPNVSDALTVLRRVGFRLVVVTNQPDVDAGKQSKAVVEAMHRRLAKELPLDQIEVCYCGEARLCRRRKPAPEMLLDAAQTLNIDLTRSYMVGDRWRDVGAGLAAGVTTVFIDRKYREALRGTPHHIVANLPEAAAWIVNRSTSALD
jgi:D-glycero-D-manno-heptose 1,7-bisphosphate phosphatase